jgi:hypothetical protein
MMAKSPKFPAEISGRGGVGDGDGEAVGEIAIAVGVLVSTVVVVTEAFAGAEVTSSTGACCAGVELQALTSSVQHPKIKIDLLNMYTFRATLYSASWTHIGIIISLVQEERGSNPQGWSDSK